VKSKTSSAASSMASSPKEAKGNSSSNDPDHPKVMLKAYRLVSPGWVDTAFSGEGARKYGGRWNSPGRPVVYLGGSRALTALELLVHLTTPLSRAKAYSLMEASIPDSCCESMTQVSPANLPDGWRLSPPGKDTMEIGDLWLASGTTLLLSVPSAIIPEETNLLLNPRHPLFPKIKIPASTPFTLRIGHQPPTATSRNDPPYSHS
jgi:RES domain-containing protein